MYALRTNSSITNGTTASNITIGSGGIIANANSTIAPNLAFGSAEAVVGVYKGNQSLTLSGTLTGTGRLSQAWYGDT